MKKNIVFMIGIILIVFSYFYCTPNSFESYELFITQMLNGLFFNYGVYFLLKYLSKKKKLTKLIYKTNNLLIYFPNFLVFLHCLLTFFYIITMIWERRFELAGTILPTLFSISASRLSNEVIKREISG